MITLRSDVANIKAEVGGIQLEIKKINDVLITQADQNRRILHLRLSRVAPRPRIHPGPQHARDRSGVPMIALMITIIGAVLFVLGAAYISRPSATPGQSQVGVVITMLGLAMVIGSLVARWVP
jgi:predicted phage tail protein